MTNVDLFVLLFSGIWCLIGVIFAAVGYGVRRSWLRREERLRGRTEGVVAEVVRRGTRESAAWYPIVEFTAEGRRISLESDAGGGRKKYYEGQTVMVRYDPDEPACFEIVGDESRRMMANVFLVVGLGCVAIGLGVGLAVKYFAPETVFAGTSLR